MRMTQLRWLFQFALPFLLATASGCTSYQNLENARSRGAQAGNNEGRRAGEAEGFSTTAKAAQKEAYQETVTQLYSSGDYLESPSSNVAVFYCFAVLGFGLQWIFFYIPRRVGYLLDIDWIVLPDAMTEIDLTDFSADQMNPTPWIPPSAGPSLIVLLMLLPAIGCTGSEKSAWQEGYDANYRSAYHAGWQDGAARGKKEGQELGKVAAQSAATTGHAWQFYATNALWGLTVGVIVGVSAQYIILLRCRITGRVAELWMVTFIPAFKRSVAYSILERRRALILWWNEEVEKLAATKKLKARQMRSIQEVIEQKLRAIASLKGFSQSRLIDIAQHELARIVSASEQVAIESRNNEDDAESLAPNVGNARPWWLRKRQETN